MVNVDDVQLEPSICKRRDRSYSIAWQSSNRRNRPWHIVLTLPASGPYFPGNPRTLWAVARIFRRRTMRWRPRRSPYWSPSVTRTYTAPLTSTRSTTGSNLRYRERCQWSCTVSYPTTAAGIRTRNIQSGGSRTASCLQWTHNIRGWVQWPLQAK